MTGVYLVVGFIVVLAVILTLVAIPLYLLFEWVCALWKTFRLVMLLKRKGITPWEDLSRFQAYTRGFVTVAWKLMIDEFQAEVNGIIVPRYPWQKYRRAPMWS